MTGMAAPISATREIALSISSPVTGQVKLPRKRALLL
jgi:hypothetical protein